MKKWFLDLPLCPLFKGKQGLCRPDVPLIGVWGERCEGWLAPWGGDSGIVMAGMWMFIGVHLPFGARMLLLDPWAGDMSPIAPG